MKIKPKGKTSMKEFAGDYKSTKRDSGLFVPEETKLVGTMDSNFEQDKQEREKYNKAINKLDKDYVKFIPNRKLLIRCKVLEYTISKSGLAIKPSIPIAIKTQSGIGIKEVQDSPYPYSVEAVVISVPDGFEKYKKGDNVIIPKSSTIARRDNIEVPFHMPNAFMLPEWTELEPPTDMKNKHYGYLLVDNHDILGQLK